MEGASRGSRTQDDVLRQLGGPRAEDQQPPPTWGAQLRKAAIGHTEPRVLEPSAAFPSPRAQGDMWPVEGAGGTRQEQGRGGPRVGAPKSRPQSHRPPRCSAPHPTGPATGPSSPPPSAAGDTGGGRGGRASARGSESTTRSCARGRPRGAHSAPEAGGSIRQALDARSDVHNSPCLETSCSNHLHFLPTPPRLPPCAHPDPRLAGKGTPENHGIQVSPSGSLRRNAGHQEMAALRPAGNAGTQEGSVVMERASRRNPN